MNILDIGIQEGERRAKEEGIISMIKACKDLNIFKEQVLEQLVDKFSVEKEEAQKYMEMYW